MKKIIIIIFSLFLLQLSYAYEFKFIHKKDDQFRLVASSVQTAFINNEKIAVYDQGYKATLRVIEAGKDYGKLKGKYYYMARPYGAKGSYKVLENRIYKTEFIKKSNGEITIGKQFFYPVVRNLPLFPKKDVKIGETWEGTGQEAQDFRKIGIRDPFVVPFKVRYQYLKDEEKNGKKYAIIKVFYYINFKFSNAKIRSYPGRNFPVRVMGFFNGNVKWDKKLNEMTNYEGNYNFIYIMNNGVIREWKGKDNGEVIVIRNNKEEENKLKKEAKEQIGIAEIKEDKEGIRLIFSDILFDFNKTNLKKGIIPTLTKVLNILKKYKKYEVRVEGHSDDIGLEKFKRAIAEARAKVVADFLVKNGISEKRVSYMGFSDKKPLVPNNSEKNRAKNRRVEIYIITK